MGIIMKSVSKIGGLAVGLCTVLLTGCLNSSANITGTRLDAASPAPQRLLVFSDVGLVLKNKHDGDEEDVFSREFVGALGKCGVTAFYLQKRPLDNQLTLDDSAKLKDDRGLSSNTFAADAILDIQWSRQTKSTGGPSSADYSLSVMDIKTKRPIWKGQMSFVSAWYGGQRFAATLIDRLRQDGVIPATCVAPEVPKA